MSLFSLTHCHVDFLAKFAIFSLLVSSSYKIKSHILTLNGHFFLIFLNFGPISSKRSKGLFGFFNNLTWITTLDETKKLRYCFLKIFSAR